MSNQSAAEASAASFTPAASQMFPGGFTVLMAVYGRDDPQLFQRAVDSVYQNTVTPDEFVLVVDGPIPPTLDRVIQECTRDRGIRTLSLAKNVGLANALNCGLEHVRTAWVVRADADDINLPYRFERQAEAIHRIANDVDLLSSAILEVDRTGEPLAIRDVPLRHDQIVSRLATRNPFNHMAVAYRTDVVRNAGGYPDIHLKEDYALWASMVAIGARCMNVGDVLVRATTGRDMYRRRGGIKHARSEWDLQLHLFKLGHKGLVSAVMFGMLRAVVSLLPAAARGWLYKKVFRTRHNG